MATVASRSAVAGRCPACSAAGREVAALTVRTLVTPEAVDRVREGGYWFCPSPACEVVYFQEADGGSRFLRSDLRVRVGRKETAPPIPVCYCFDWTTDDLERELRLTGDTAIPERVKQKTRQGFCRCETMNPEGTCCLGNLRRAVDGIRARLAGEAGVAPGPRPGEGAVPADAAAGQAHARGGREGERGAWPATLGAVFTAVVGSACCWLPLLLIAFGFSAAGVGNFLEQYRPPLLCATFALLAVAWYLTYRPGLRRAWARLRGQRAPGPGGVGGCASATRQGVHACCAAGVASDPADCCGPSAGAVPGQPAGRWFNARQANQVMLWLSTLVILLFTLFPGWIDLVVGNGGLPPAPAVSPEGQQVILEVQGMTCAGCAASVRQALSRVPGVDRAEVDYRRGEAVVTAHAGGTLQPEALVRAVEDAGYQARPQRK